MKKVLLVVVVAALAVFCAFNLQPIRVWPFATQLPLFVVVLGAFVLGLAAGWVGRALASSRRKPAPIAEAVPAETKR